MCACARVSACTYARVPMRMCALRVRVYACVYACARVHRCPQKRQKIRRVRRKRDPQGIEKKSFSDRGIARRLAIVPKHSTFLIFFLSLCSPFKIMIMIGRKLSIGNSIYQGGYAGADGLTVKDGRLINNRADGQTGIAQLAKIRKDAKREEKVSMIAEGYSRGEMMAETREMMVGAFKLKL